MSQQAKKTEVKRTPNITIILGGGTIGSIVKDGVRHGGGNSVDLLQNTVALTNAEAVNVFGGLSENMTLEIQTAFANKILETINKGTKRIVVTHGTDTLTQTAAFLETSIGSLVRDLDSTVIITASIHDTSHPNTDVWSNLDLAAQSALDAKPGIYVAFHGKLIEASKVAIEPFNGHEMNYIDKDSAEYKALLKLVAIRDERVIESLARIYATELETIDNSRVMVYKLTRVGQNHLAFLKQVKEKQPIAVIFETYHSGTALTDQNADFSHRADVCIQTISEMGILCFAVAENGEAVDLSGRTKPVYETGIQLAEAGLIGLEYDISLQVAASKAAIIVNKYPDISEQELIELMKTINV